MAKDIGHQWATRIRVEGEGGREGGGGENGKEREIKQRKEQTGYRREDKQKEKDAEEIALISRQIRLKKKDRRDIQHKKDRKGRRRFNM